MMALPLTFVPGTMCDDRLWRPMLTHLPGCQPVFCDYSAAETMEDMAEAVLDQSPALSHLIGFSLGGYLAIEAAISAPHRFESLTVIAASPYGLTDAEKALRRRNGEMLTRLTYKGMSPARLKQFVHESHLDDEAITGTILAMERDLGQEVLIRQLIAPIERPNIAAGLLDLPFPVHFIMAEDDALVPIGAIEKLAAKSERITLHRIKGTTGHMIPLEAPAELAGLLIDILD
ncbi:alpha/beta fold hydrolase [Kordiimonas marina]|uniref:alpha/beta fold hydrolase n=1 Tax=Kordiimonas marina TaxID=2872312 RepID=UPI001FF36463|nr:alpha/beta hydrolase [Kordiimonas marina]MCJ9429869.1 alpha/beta hydrolase [Kordiimonas marina]